MRRSPTAGEASETESPAPSKSQLKRDSHALQSLGERLVDLSDERLLQLPITERLIDAVRLARGIRAREGRRRQMQFIGRLMRDEADIEAIRVVLDGDRQQQRLETALMHAAEHWRARMLSDPAAVALWQERHPETRDALQSLLPAARTELASGQHGRRYRELFRLIRSTLDANSPQSPDS